MKTLLTSLTVLILSATGLSQTILFSEEQVERNLEHKFYHTNFNGGGIAFVDIDNDGDDDAYLTGGNDRDRLMLNDGNGYFTEAAGPNGLEITEDIYTSGVVYGDIDNDGDKDLFVNTHAGENGSYTYNILFRNNGDLTFTNIWSSETDKSMTMGSVFIDYDLDGDLDIYNVNYVENIKFTYDENNVINGFDHDCYQNYMYQNMGDGVFEDVTEQVQLHDTGCALAVTASDYDLDGDLDLLIGNDFGPFIEPNKLYRNDIDEGVFTEVGMSTNSDNEMFSMGIAVGDYDNDLDLDYYISNMSKNVLLQNNNGDFSQSAEEAGVENQFVAKDSSLSISWGTLFTDVNNDMFVDLFISNGYVPAPAFVDNGNLEPDKLYINNTDKTFTEMDSTCGIWNEITSRGCAYSDVNNDGLIDIYSVVFDKPTFGVDGASCLYMNKSVNTNNWIGVNLKGTNVNKDAYGSKVYIHTGNETQMREISGGSSFCSHNSSIAHFGLSNHTAVDSIVVSWTGGKKYQTVYNPQINTKHTIEENSTSSTSSIDFINVEASPNPTSGLVNILADSEIRTITLSSINGKELTSLNDINSKRYSLELLNYATGYYLITIYTSKGTKTLKIFKD